MNEQENLLDDFVEEQSETPETQNEEIKKNIIPSRVDEDWSNFLMSKLKDNELYWTRNEKGEKDKCYPKVNGLRRLTLCYLGLVTKSGIANFVPPSLSIQEGRIVQQYAVVVYEIIIKLHGTGDIIHYSEIADAHPQYNLDKFVSGYPCPMAATRAEARALRKALGLDVTSAEEIQGGGKDVAEILNQTNNNDASNQDSIQNDQINFINNLCRKMNIDLNKVINGKLRDLTREEAQNLCSDLTKWHKNKNVPGLDTQRGQLNVRSRCRRLGSLDWRGRKRGRYSGELRERSCDRHGI
jgi:hypothetical protein